MTITKISVKLSATLASEHKALKVDAINAKLDLIRRAIKLFRKVDLDQLNHTVSAENLEFRKSLFPNYRFWMRDVKVAGEQGLLNRREMIDLATFARGIAVQIIGELRAEYPASATVVEVVECDENGRPVTEVLEEALAYERSKREEVSAINCQLVQERKGLKTKIKQLKAENTKQHKAIRIKDQQIKVLKAALHTVAGLEETI